MEDYLTKDTLNFQCLGKDCHFQPSSVGVYPKRYFEKLQVFNPIAWPTIPGSKGCAREKEEE